MNKKRILILGDAASIHLEKWALALTSQGFNIAIFSLRKTPNEELYAKSEVTLFDAIEYKNKENRYFNSLNKIHYLRALPALKKVINEYKPTIIHAHYASSYGLLGALCKFKPFIISVWGSDVLTFPKNNLLASFILRYNFSKADKILVTSLTLLKATKKFTKKPLKTIAFGIDTKIFYPTKKEKNDSLIFGSAKALTSIYGHDVALKAFSLAKNKLPENSQFIFAGNGSEKSNLVKLVTHLNLIEHVTFLGHLSKEEIIAFFNKIDVLINLSRTESFGVAVLEAAACEVPAIVTDIGGLKEVVNQNITGLRIPVNDENKAAKAMISLGNDKELIRKMGQNARKNVLTNFEWSECVKEMSLIYNSYFESIETMNHKT